MRKVLTWSVGLFVAAYCAVAFSATIPLVTGPVDVAALQAALNSIIQSVNSNVQPLPPQTPRNFIDNGAMQVQQRGTGAATCATTGAIASANYAADRWACDVNVGSGAGALTPITATPSPPVGFTFSQKLVRTGGALVQPQCAWQEIPTFRATMLAGQQVVVSAFIQALAGLAADQGSTTQTATLVIVTGTGSDQGFGTWTASPAITPAWTGLATLQTTTAALPVTPAWARYAGAAVTVPTTVTEIAVAICFTPTAAGQSATDGIAFTGVQLEPVGANVTTPSPFEFKPLGLEQLEAFRYGYHLTETVAISPIASCTASSTTVAQCLIPFPVPLRAAPTMTFTAGFASPTTTAQSTLGACTGLAASTVVASTVGALGSALVQCTATTIPAAGSATLLYNNNGSGAMHFSADF